MLTVRDVAGAGFNARHLAEGAPCHRALRLAATELTGGDPMEQMAAAAFMAIGAG